jgi:CBS domain-containing protein
MSLKWYRRPRLVALNANTPVLEAARAIENNTIGGVVVQNKGRVVGIVTDRDLATPSWVRDSTRKQLFYQKS